MRAGSARVPGRGDTARVEPASRTYDRPPGPAMRTTSPRTHAPRSSTTPEIPMRTPATPNVLLPLALATLGMLAGCADAPTAASRHTEFRALRAAGSAVERPWKGRCDV